MNKHALKIVFILMIGGISFQTREAKAQCAANAVSDTINWDFQYFNTLPASGINYMLGVSSMRMSWTALPSNTNTFVRTNATHTGELTSFGRGNDANFNVSNGSDTLVFADTVRNLKFSVFDIDVNQILTITAKDINGNPIFISNLAKANAASSILITGSGTAIAVATATSGTDIASTSDLATVNVTINGPVKTVVLTFTKGNTTADNIWISDISACVVGSWPTGYQYTAAPEVGQHHYVIGNNRNKIMVIDIDDTTSTVLFTDPAFLRLNSIAYDPQNQWVYYCDHNASPSNRTVYKYNVKTGVKSVAIADVTTLGVTLESGGLGSGGGAFYAGSLFLGVDANTVSGESDAIYRIDFNASGVAVKASRFWGVLGTSGSSYLYNWGDYVINNGILYNFNCGPNAVANTQVQHLSLNTQKYINSYSTTRIWQAAIDYNGNVYNMRNDSIYSYSAGVLGIGRRIKTGFAAGDTVFDAAEAFKYPYDFGDAPLSYGVAFHLFKTTPDLTLGGVIDYQVNDTTNNTASADDLFNTGSVDDEEAVTTFPAITVANTSYTVPVSTTNSSGATATLYGFIDFNRDGDFADAGERSAAATVPNGTTTATPVNVVFTGLTGGSVGGSFIRFRIANSGSEAGSRFGYAATGEVEDYDIPITASSLPVELVEFKATAKDNKTTLLNWTTASEMNNDYFEVQRKQNNSWESIGKVNGFGFSNHLNFYDFIDKTPYDGINYYQLKQVDFDGKTEFSPMVSVSFENKNNTQTPSLTLFPNPAVNEVYLKSDQMFSANNSPDIEVYNSMGEKLQAFKMKVSEQRVDLSNYPKGMYLIKTDDQTFKVIKK